MYQQEDMHKYVESLSEESEARMLEDSFFPSLPRVVFDPESMEEVVGERFFIFPIKADGRCLFRALVRLPWH